jgi:Fe-S-cluster containining protein
MLFDHCSVCKSCCVVDKGHPPLEISLTDDEAKRLGSICITRKCVHLGPQGCTLGDEKPFSCSLYPLSYNPKTKRFSYDIECPVMPEYIAQLKDDSSEASRHLQSMASRIAVLEKQSPDYLADNHQVDVDYFELKALPQRAARKKV